MVKYRNLSVWSFSHRGEEISTASNKPRQNAKIGAGCGGQLAGVAERRIKSASSQSIVEPSEASRLADDGPM